ncbi:UDP-N-acetylmuramate dehydrogenase [Parasporobacterium paucivorans]|nr:UDP-N-acetylmuramate dehydrogenase [Parasporobacterium paucivorans]
MEKDIIRQFCDIAGTDNVETDAPMNRYTTFRTGGPADCMVSPGTIEQIRQLLKICRENKIKYFVMGNGSNVIVRDSGYRGLIIRINKNFSGIRLEGEMITAQAGMMLSKVAAAASTAGLTGMEFASGIPGTLGGALGMNAGAYGGEMSQIVEWVKVMDQNGDLRTLSREELEYEYRNSRILKENYIALEAGIRLEKGDPDRIKQTTEELGNCRREKQPLEYPSAGSTFKRPAGSFAGKLIMDAGLAGRRVGDAQVSEKHCGFIINRGNATSGDILALMQEVKDIVYKKTGISLESEVKILD